MGNLLVLARSVNSALQDKPFKEKKKVVWCNDTGKPLKHGYEDGSYSELQVAEEKQWGQKQIRNRGLRLLSFMEERWKFAFSETGKRELAGPICK